MTVESDANFHFQAGNAAFKQQAYDEAVAHFTRALQLNPGYGKALFNRAQSYRKLREIEAAITDYRSGLAIERNDAAAHLAFGEFLIALRRQEEALEPLERAVALRPDWHHAHVRLGLTLRILQRPLDALFAFERALALNPNDRETLVHKATCELMAGYYEAGWRSYEARIDFSTYFHRVGFSQPMWLGDSDIDGKTILVHAEQGLGDTLQFCRYVPLLETAGAHVLFAPQPPLKRLMQSLSPTVSIVDIENSSLEFDVHCRLLSLPLAFKTTTETIPANTPYLASDASRFDLWKRRLHSESFKIGVCWQGSLQGQKLGRSFDPRSLSAIGQIPNVRLIGLQRGDDPEQLRLAAQAGIEIAGDYFSSGEDDFVDVAAIIENCDLVISADTSILHLAGALNRPTWAPLSTYSDWRWLTDRSDSPWYPKLRLFHTNTYGNFSDVFSKMAKDIIMLRKCI